MIDLAFRYGGDEFVLFLPQTSKENAMGVARRLHKLIRETVWLKESGINVHVTASVGVAPILPIAHQGRAFCTSPMRRCTW